METRADERKLLGGRINFPLSLAPMVGLSHLPFRRVCRRYLPPGVITLWPTEMLSSRRLPNENVGATPETLRGDEESELVPQILGNEEGFIRNSVRRLQDWGATGIDINMGCPVRKALQHNYGVALMGDPLYAAEVVRMTVRNSQVPVSVKLRAPSQTDVRAPAASALIDFVQGLEQAGAAWITLHPRTASQMRRGQADWAQIRELRSALQIPVIGNGDVQQATDVVSMLQLTGCDAVMVGRALTARPWMFWQLGEILGYTAPIGREFERAPQTPLEEGAEYGRMLQHLAHEMEQSFNQELGLRKFKFFVRTGSPWLQFGHELFAKLSACKTWQEIEQKRAEFFSQEQSMTAKTELRQ